MALERPAHLLDSGAGAQDGAGRHDLKLHNTLEQLAVAEEELRQQNDELIDARVSADAERERYRRLFDAAPEAYFVTDVYGKIREANLAATALLGLTADRVIGKPVFNFIEHSQRAHMRFAIATALRTSGVIHEVFALAAPKGSGREVEASIMLQITSGAKAVSWMVRDLTEQAQYARRLAALNIELDERVRARTAELERASAVKDEFLGLVSHELRTPITTIFGNAEILRRKGARMDEQTRAAAVEDIYAESSRLQRLVDDLLLLARSQSTVAELEPVLPQRVVSSVAAAFQRERGRAVVVHSADGLPAVNAEPTYLEQVLRNLLSNAEKYSPPGRPIEISVARAGPRVRFAVADRGDGIPEGQLTRIFLAFVRSPERRPDAPGLGVGLAVCRRLMEAQGGRIWARRREGGGMEFVFTLTVAGDWDTDTAQGDEL